MAWGVSAVCLIDERHSNEFSFYPWNYLLAKPYQFFCAGKRAPDSENEMNTNAIQNEYQMKNRNKNRWKMFRMIKLFGRCLWASAQAHFCGFGGWRPANSQKLKRKQNHQKNTNTNKKRPEMKEKRRDEPETMPTDTETKTTNLPDLIARLFPSHAIQHSFEFLLKCLSSYLFTSLNANQSTMQQKNPIILVHVNFKWLINSAPKAHANPERTPKTKHTERYKISICISTKG